MIKMPTKDSKFMPVYIQTPSGYIPVEKVENAEISPFTTSFNSFDIGDKHCSYHFVLNPREGTLFDMYVSPCSNWLKMHGYTTNRWKTMNNWRKKHGKKHGKESL